MDVLSHALWSYEHGLPVTTGWLWIRVSLSLWPLKSLSTPGLQGQALCDYPLCSSCKLSFCFRFPAHIFPLASRKNAELSISRYFAKNENLPIPHVSVDLNQLSP